MKKPALDRFNRVIPECFYRESGSDRHGGLLQEKLPEKLRTLMRGRVLDDEKSLRQFSRDRSIYEITPRAVVFPDDDEDVRRLAEFARREGVPVTARGGGSGLAGSALGEGLVMALPKNEFWSGISGFSASGRSARVSASAGVFHNDLQVFLKERGFFLPADVTSAEISRIGGNIATRASGPHALKYGSIDRFLESLQFITAEGELVDTADEATIPARFKEKLADLERRIRGDGAARAVLESRTGMKTASGYNLSAFLTGLSPGERIAKLLAGNVGTLGLITRAFFRAEVHERDLAAVVLYFDALAETGRAVQSLQELDVAAVELISRETLRVLRDHAPLPGELAPDAHLLFVELTGTEAGKKAKSVVNFFHHGGYRMSVPPAVVTAPEAIEQLWKVRRRILWQIEHPQPGLRAFAVVNDVGVPVDRLAEFIHDVQRVFAEHGTLALVYGHAGNGNLHLRPLFDLALPDIRGRVRRLADEVYEAVFRYGGTVTAEHGMGRLRAPYLAREWGEALYDYMREVKRIFDPEDLLNPGVMFGNAPITDHMREDLLEP